MPPITARTCDICGDAIFGGAGTTCGTCLQVAPNFTRALAYGSYDGGLRELIHLLKYDQVRPAAKVLGRMLAEVLAEITPKHDKASLVVPVPLHASRLRERGFNQAEEIARTALNILSHDGSLAGRLELAADVLRRRRPTESQTGLTRHQRMENIRGAFEVAHPERIAARNVILVDDVFTTGTTVGECARILRRGGASRVYVATVARVLRSQEAHVELDGTNTEAEVLALAAGA